MNLAPYPDYTCFDMIACRLVCMVCCTMGNADVRPNWPREEPAMRTMFTATEIATQKRYKVASKITADTASSR
jgi:hypothetical protein